MLVWHAHLLLFDSCLHDAITGLAEALRMDEWIISANISIKGLVKVISVLCAFIDCPLFVYRDQLITTDATETSQCMAHV